jgi:hypothetical protein
MDSAEPIRIFPWVLFIDTEKEKLSFFSEVTKQE